MMIPATLFYAGLIGLLLIALSLRVVRRRRGKLISLGDGGDAEMQKRIRAHANLTEYAPIGLILLGSLELSGLSGLLVHIFGLMLVIGRGAHAYAVSYDVMRFRQAGMLLTFASILLMALSAIWISIF